MVNAERSSSARGVRCRLLTEADFGAVADLLATGSARHRRATRLRVLDGLSRYPTPEGLPRFGYVLDVKSDRLPVAYFDEQYWITWIPGRPKRVPSGIFMRAAQC